MRTIKLLFKTAATAVFIGLLAACKGDDMAEALASGNLERVKEAVDGGADVNKARILLGPDATPLYYSMRNSHAFVPEYLLSKGADPNYMSEGISLLMYTVGAHKKGGLEYGNMASGRQYETLLNDPRTDINLAGKLGYTALDYACRDNGSLSLVNYLLDHGANITATTMQCAVEGYIYGSYSNCEEPVLKLVYDSLTAQGVPSGLDPEVEAVLRGDMAKLRALANAGQMKPENEQAVMYLTAAFGDAETLKIFVDRCDDIDKWFGERTLLGIAASYGKLETVAYLVSLKVDLEAVSGPSYLAETPMLKAIKHDRMDIAEYLYQCGAEIPAYEDISYPNALEHACRNGNIGMIKWILGAGYPLTPRQEEGAMSSAARADTLDALRYLLNDLHFDIDAPGFILGTTVLGGASSSASLDIVKFLVDSGANINGGKNDYSPPLREAVTANRLDVAAYLIEQGADVNLAGTSDHGTRSTRPLTIAIREGYFDMVKLLVENGADVHYSEGWSGGNDTPAAIAKRYGSARILAYIEAAAK